MVWPILANPIHFCCVVVGVGVGVSVCVVVCCCVLLLIVVSCGCLSFVVVVRGVFVVVVRVVFVVVCCCGSCWWCGCWFGPPCACRRTPLHRTPSAGPPKNSRFFFRLPPPISLFFVSHCASAR